MASNRDNRQTEESIRMGKNLRFLRDREGLTQSDVADLLGLGSRKTICGYEKGDIIPKKYHRQLADYFDVSIEEFKNNNIEGDADNQMSVCVEPDEVESFFSKLGIYQISPEAIKNDDFLRGDELLKIILTGDISSVRMAACRNRFYNSFKKGNIMEGAANVLMMLFLEYIWLVISDFPPELLQKYAFGVCQRTEFFQWVDSVRFSKECIEFLDSTDSVFYECLGALKNTAKWNELYEFYFSARYLVYIVDNGVDYNNNLKIGIDMLVSFVKQGNYFCALFLNNFLKLIA